MRNPREESDNNEQGPTAGQAHQRRQVLRKNDFAKYITDHDYSNDWEAVLSESPQWIPMSESTPSDPTPLPGPLGPLSCSGFLCRMREARCQRERA